MSLETSPTRSAPRRIAFLALCGFRPVSWQSRVTLKLLRDEAQALLKLSEVSGKPETIPQGDGKEVHREEEWPNGGWARQSLIHLNAGG